MNRVHVAWISSIRSRSWDCTSVIIQLPPSSGRNKGEQVHGTQIPGGKFLFQLMHKSHHSTARFLEPRAVKVQCSLYTHIPLAVRPIVCPSVRTSLPIMLVVKVQCSLYTHPTPQCSVSLSVLPSLLCLQWRGTVLIIYPPHLTYVRPTYGFVIFIRIIFIRHNIPVGAMLSHFHAEPFLVIVAVLRLQ